MKLNSKWNETEQTTDVINSHLAPSTAQFCFFYSSHKGIFPFCFPSFKHKVFETVGAISKDNSWNKQHLVTQRWSPVLNVVH